VKSKQNSPAWKKNVCVGLCNLPVVCFSSVRKVKSVLGSVCLGMCMATVTCSSWFLGSVGLYRDLVEL
jgi:hypothetical protein